MFRKTTMALAATLVLGSASLALADDYAIDQNADAIRNYGTVINHTAPLTSKHVKLQGNVQTGTQNSNWMDRASQNFDGGGY